MALTELQRNIYKDEVINDLCKRNNLLINIVHCIGDDELSVGKKAGEIIHNIGFNCVGIGRLIQKDVLEAFKTVLNKNEVVRLRVYEVD